jgi:Fe-S-cluster-containing dehydrogenase component
VTPQPAQGQQAGVGVRGTQPAEQDVAAVVAAQTPPPPMTAEQRAAQTFERNWRRWLHDGFIAGTGFATGAADPTGAAQLLQGQTPPSPTGASGFEVPFVPTPMASGPAAPQAPAGTAPPPAPAAAGAQPAPDAPGNATAAGAQAPGNVSPGGAITARAPLAPVDGIEVNFRRDPTIYDGRFANNAWLQELPKPVTKLTWDNAALVAPATATRLGVETGDLIEVQHEGRRLRVPVWITAGHAQDAVTIYLGYGRTRAGRVGNGTGFNGYVLRGSASPWYGAAEVTTTRDRYQLVSTQNHWTLEGRNIVRSAPLDEFKAQPTFAHEMEHMKLDKPISLYPNWEYTGHQWGMAIDLNTCTGCTACVIACVAENNIPIVGKEQVAMNREMHWLRVDTYFTGPLDNPNTFQQPMPCQQCEKAPCEVVCPVAATAHSDDGLNDMIYNRCVGTRYCSNNCPYKVRRFNFLLYADWNTETLKLQRNPDVTVRSRGVMEKCTYCVQRISSARIQAKREDRPIADGEVLTACQAACPTDSIVFGDVNDANSRVSLLKASTRNYAALAELNTRPRTTYLAAVRNPHPSLPSFVSVGGHATELHGHESDEQH